MILILLLVIVAAMVSVLLAYLSLYDYQDLPKHEVYSLFLVKDPQAITVELLKTLNERLTVDDEIISFEKLLKGARKALVLYGPINLIKSLELELVELEDYSKLPDKNIFCWEVTPKKSKHKLDLVFPEVLVGENEQVFYQLVLQKHKDSFQATARVAVVAEDITRKLKLMNDLSRLLEGRGFIRKNHKKTSSTQFKAYKLRAATPKEIYPFNLTFEGLVKLLK